MKNLFLFLLLAISLSITAQEDTRYFASKLYNKGEYEITIFNNYYSDKKFNIRSNDFDGRENFYTINSQLLYGLSSKWNVGLDIKVRSVTLSQNFIDPTFEALKFQNDGKYPVLNGTAYHRSGLTAIGLRSKLAPFKSVPNFSMQNTFYIPIGKELEGNDATGFIDWNGFIFTTQFFYDKELTSKLSLFTEVDIIIENIGKAMFSKESGYYQYSTPMTMILSYFPNQTHTVFGLINSAPQWAGDYNHDTGYLEKFYVPFNQYGIGYKYAVGERWLFEVIWTKFLNGSVQNQIYTYNIGVRYFVKE